ncbi:MAG: hypothetical protein HQM10_00585 [Candidatus Riflebacteria bacterium]|nr:hypothetical protein [Candidatus Riflebacteria bacterium]
MAVSEVLPKKFEQILKHRNHIIELLQVELEKTKKNHESEISTLKHQLSEQNQIVLPSDSEEKLSLQKEISQLRELAEKYLSNQEELQREIVQFKKAAQEDLFEKELLQNQLKKLSEVKENNPSAEEDLRKQLEKLKEASEINRNSQEELQQKISSREKEISDLQEKLNLVGYERNLAEEKIDTLTSEIESIKAEAKSPEAIDITSCQAEFRELVERLQQIETEEENRTEELNKLRSENQSCMALLESRTSELEKLRTQMQISLQELDSIRKQNRELSVNVNRLENKNQSLTENVDSTRRESSVLKNEYGILKSEVSVKDEQIKSFEKLVSEIKSELKSVKSEKEKLSSELLEKSRHSNAVINEKNRTLQERENLLRKLNEFESEIADLRARNFGLHRIIFESPKIIRKEIGVQKNSISKIESESISSEEMDIHLPFLFPDRLPGIIRINHVYSRKPQIIRTEKISRNSFPVRRSHTFLKTFLENVPAAPERLRNIAAGFQIAENRFTAENEYYELSISEEKHFPHRFGVIFYPSTISTFSRPSSDLPVKLSHSRIEIDLHINNFNFFISHLITDSKIRNAMRLQKVIKCNEKFSKSAKKTIEKYEFKTSVKFSDSFFRQRIVESVKKITFEEKTFSLYLPKGKLGMLMKSIENSISSLHSRLDSAKTSEQE